MTFPATASLQCAACASRWHRQTACQARRSCRCCPQEEQAAHASSPSFHRATPQPLSLSDLPCLTTALPRSHCRASQISCLEDQSTDGLHDPPSPSPRPRLLSCLSWTGFKVGLLAGSRELHLCISATTWSTVAIWWNNQPCTIHGHLFEVHTGKVIKSATSGQTSWKWVQFNSILDLFVFQQQVCQPIICHITNQKAALPM